MCILSFLGCSFSSGKEEEEEEEEEKEAEEGEEEVEEEEKEEEEEETEVRDTYVHVRTYITELSLVYLRGLI